MKCNNCGKELRAGATFCTGCGTRIEIEPQAPCVSSIPEPPKMPDLPTNPIMPSEQQVYQQPYQQLNQQQPSWAPPPAGAPPPPPWTTPASAAPVKANKGLIAGLIIGGVVLIAAAIVIGILAGRLVIQSANDIGQAIHDEIIVPETPPIPPSPGERPPTPEPPQTPVPPPTPPPPGTGRQISDDELSGIWDFDAGDPLWFFGDSDYIMIIDHHNGTYGVFESASEEWGILRILDGGRFHVEGDWSGEYEFSYRITGNWLVITDVDGDEAHYSRVE